MISGEDNQPINVFRSKAVADNCVTFQINLPVASFEPAFAKLSPEDRDSIGIVLTAELDKVKDFYEFDLDHEKIGIIKFIPITSLTKASFERAMYQIHQDGAHIVHVIKKELKRRESPTH